MQGATQGPFAPMQLAAWAASGELPLDLIIYHTDGVETQSFQLRCLLGREEQQLRRSPESQIEKDAEDSWSYSEAALAALPEHDETRQLAQLAVARGTTLQEVVAFCHCASQSSQPDLEQQGAHEVGPTKSQSSPPKGPPLNWKRAKKLRKLRKEKQRTAWLYS